MGWISTIWLSSSVSQGDHRLSHLEPWVAHRSWTLQTAAGQAIDRLDGTDDRLEIVLCHCSDDERWAQLASRLNQHSIHVYDLRPARVHVDSTTSSAYTGVRPEGLLQFGHRKGHRPDLPQVKGMQAVLDPLGLPLAIDVVSSERADDLRYVPCIARVQRSLDRRGLLFVGYGKMAAFDTRAFVALAGDDYLCPLPQVQVAEGELDQALEWVRNGGQALKSVWREQEQGELKHIAQGYEYQVPLSVEVEGKGREWSERRSVVRSLRHAQTAEAVLRARMAKTKAEVEALNLRGRGCKRFEAIETLCQTVNVIVQRHCVEDFL
jgi:transposase